MDVKATAAHMDTTSTITPAQAADAWCPGVPAALIHWIALIAGR